MLNEQLPVTLYIPYYKAGSTISFVLEGVSLLDPKPEEIIIIDDGSNEDLSSLNQICPIKIIRHDKNKGLAASRNTALGYCKTTFIASLDADVVPASNWLGLLYDAITNRDIAGVGGYLYEYYTDTLPNRWRAKHRPQHFGDKEMINPPFIAGANTLFRTDALRQAGGYDEGLRTNSEDVAISESIYKAGLKLLYLPSVRAKHLRRDSILSLLRLDYAWSIRSYINDGKYSSLKSMLRQNFLKFNHLIMMDLKDREFSFIMIDKLLLFYTLIRDIRRLYSSNSVKVGNSSS